jgi:hypothetical protein
VESVDSAAGDEDDPRYATWTCERAREVHGADVRRMTVYRVTQHEAPVADPPEPSVVALLERECGASPPPAHPN